MALKAGRVGVAPDQVDDFGKVKSDVTSGYTKQEADAKFETQIHAASTYETKSDAAALQPIQLSVPIDLLNGSALTVESALSGINNEVNDLYEEHTSAVTDIIEGATVLDGDNHLFKVGNVVQFILRLSHVTTPTAWNAIIANIPEGYRPRYIIRRKDFGDTGYNISPLGEIVLSSAVTDKTITICETWITRR